jgi:hypothetical protein
MKINVAKIMQRAWRKRENINGVMWLYGVSINVAYSGVAMLMSYQLA